MQANLNSFVNICYAIVVRYQFEFRGEDPCVEIDHRTPTIFKTKESLIQCMTRCHNNKDCNAVSYKEKVGDLKCWGTHEIGDSSAGGISDLPIKKHWKCYIKKGLLLSI